MLESIISAGAVLVGAVVGFVGARLTNMQNSKDRKDELLHRSRERRADRIEDLYTDIFEQARMMRIENRETEQHQAGHGFHYQFVPEENDWVRVDPYFAPLEDLLNRIRLVASDDMYAAAKRYCESEYALLDLPGGSEKFADQSTKSSKYAEELRVAARVEMNIAPS